MTNMKKISLLAFSGLAVCCVAFVIALYASLPRYTATLTHEKLRQPVELIRDEHAVAHIYAHNERDAYYALGFAHAQDRLWQMEFNLRAASGTLAQWFGSSMLSIDRFQRSLGLADLAGQDFETLDSDTRAILAAYAAGVNAYRDSIFVPPPEYLFLGTSPRTWQAQDSLLLLKQMAWQLSRNYWDELLHVALRQGLSAQEMKDLFQIYPEDVTLPPMPESDYHHTQLEALAKNCCVAAYRKPLRPWGRITGR